MIYAKLTVLSLVSLVIFSLQATAQRLTIIDTLEAEHSRLTDSSFIIQGTVTGLDSGTLKLTWDNNVAFVPIRSGKFYVSGSVSAARSVGIQAIGDYYQNEMYVEPGTIYVRYTYQQSGFTAGGTPENDAWGYFRDTLNKENDERFWQLSQQLQAAQAAQALDRYLALTDSFKLQQHKFLETLSTALRRKRYGLYLLGTMNSFYIGGEYFAERRAIYDRLPEKWKSTEVGKQALSRLETERWQGLNLLREVAYNFRLKDAKGKAITLSQFKGKVVVLDFWATWCVPCLKALPMLKEIATRTRSKGIEFVSVSIDKDAKSWRTKEKTSSLPWRSVLADKITVEKYKMNAVPNYVVVGKDGKILSKGAALANLYVTLKRL